MPVTARPRQASRQRTREPLGLPTLPALVAELRHSLSPSLTPASLPLTRDSNYYSVDLPARMRVLPSLILRQRKWRQLQDL